MSIRALALAFYGEGATDKRFLPTLIQRTVQAILAEHQRTDIDISNLDVLNDDLHRITKQDERILEAARRAVNYHILLVHADADYPNRDRALAERIQPGFDRVRGEQAGVCAHLIPVIPVRMTEAWMLADPAGLRTVMGIAKPIHELGLPQNARQVELVLDPKARLDAILQGAHGTQKRRHRIRLETLYLPLAQQISLARLAAVPSYQQFVEDLTGALGILGLV